MTAELYQASLFVNTDEEAIDTPVNFVVQLPPTPTDGTFKCEVGEWPAGQFDAIEQRLAERNVVLLHDGAYSYFVVEAGDLLTALMKVRDLFVGLYDFEESEFWYRGPGQDRDHEFHLTDLNILFHDYVEVEPTTAGPRGERLAEQYIAALHQSGLCQPGTAVRLSGNYFPVRVKLTSEAAEQPLETFQKLVDMHPILRAAST